MVFTDVQTKTMMTRAYNASLRYLGPRMRSVREMKDFLDRKKVSDEISGTVIDRLLEAGLLDDTLFASLFVKQREASAPRSRYALRFELRKKGVSDRVIDQVLEGIDETESALRALMLKLGRWKNQAPELRKQKMMNHLRTRGFGYETAQSACDRALESLNAIEGE